MYCEEIETSTHAKQKMTQRNITSVDVFWIVANGETIKEYTDTKPYPCRLLLGFIYDRPLHVVVARDDFDAKCHVITAYEPDRDIWHSDFKTKKIIEK